jgi:NAD+ synthase/NAD+ synthase (glutamine-hydrolysing)
VKIAIGQINPTVGDFTGNAAKIVATAQQAMAAGAGLALFPELSVCGYPPRDLVEKPAFVTRNEEVVQQIAQATSGITVVCGFVSRAHTETGKSVMNSAAVLRDGQVVMVQSKRLLPTYDVFDEYRNFAPADRQRLFSLCGKQLALTICEDAWNDKSFWDRRLYPIDPVEDLISTGGNFLLNISASPFYLGKRELRRDMLAALARHQRVPVVMCNQVGGNDSLVFDGSSIALDASGKVIAQARSFEEDLIYLDTESLTGDIHDQLPGEEASGFAALVLGTRDYVRKCGFQQVLVGLSGGIDSALTATIAAAALGPENVTGVGMPGPFSSTGSIEDARAVASNLGIRFELVPIGDIFQSYLRVLQPVFAGREPDVAEENIQARIRGNILMAMSNKFGALLLSTGNKSEVGVGYCTLYGDMAGGLAVISDVPKTMVYRIANYVNSRRPVIPQATIDKPPSAELRPDQKDQDTLPPYEVLDTVLYDYVEGYRTAEQIAAAHNYDLGLVRAATRLVEKAEYKRQQAAPGLKITQKAFGVGRRFPIAAKHEV